MEALLSVLIGVMTASAVYLLLRARISPWCSDSPCSATPSISSCSRAAD